MLRCAAYRGSDEKNDDKKNQHEVDHLAGVAVCHEAAKQLNFSSPIIHLIQQYAAPFTVGHDPYFADFVAANDKRLSGEEADDPELLLTTPIPYTATTEAHLINFEYDQVDLMARVEPTGTIEAVGNSKGGFKVQAGCDDPRVEIKKTRKRGGESKIVMRNVLFGVANTTFWVRYGKKRYAVKVFQGSLFIETLGSLYVDLRDAHDVNSVVVAELRRAYDNEDIQMVDFRATMRNYKFRTKLPIILVIDEVMKAFGRIAESGEHKLYCSSKNMVRITEPDHTSKKKEVCIKIYQYKINIDSTIYKHHLDRWYKFFNRLLIDNRDKCITTPPVRNRLPSADYYEAAGVDPPPEYTLDDTFISKK
jgi:hypothetical protein